MVAIGERLGAIVATTYRPRRRHSPDEAAQAITCSGTLVPRSEMRMAHERRARAVCTTAASSEIPAWIAGSETWP